MQRFGEQFLEDRLVHDSRGTNYFNAICSGPIGAGEIRSGFGKQRADLCSCEKNRPTDLRGGRELNSRKRLFGLVDEVRKKNPLRRGTRGRKQFERTNRFSTENAADQRNEKQNVFKFAH